MNIFIDRDRLTISGVVAIALGVAVVVLGCLSIANFVSQLLDINCTEVICTSLCLICFISIYQITHDIRDDNSEMVFVSFMWYGSWFAMVLFVALDIISNLF